MADPWTIETADLRKNYGHMEAIRGLSLQVPAGSIYGFLGRNGAGKTATIKVLLGMARPTGKHLDNILNRAIIGSTFRVFLGGICAQHIKSALRGGCWCSPPRRCW